VSKKKRKPRRKKLKYVPPLSLAARASGFVVHANRKDSLARVMDEAIYAWFFEFDPFAIHLLVCPCYFVLCDLGKNNGKGPRFEQTFGRFDMTAAYDFLRHAEADVLNDSVDLPHVLNQSMLFDAINSFSKLFGTRTIYMRAFAAYFALHPRHASATLSKHGAEFLPKGISVEEASKLGRIAAFQKFTEMFATQEGID